MAVTSLWPIRGRVDHVIDYARNPEKTTQAGYGEQAALHTIDGVMEYAADEMKTERRSYVSCLNCREEIAAAQFMETKRLWGKTDGRVCYHGYQSFRADEVTAETAHEIGVRLAEELWGDRFEVLVATHCNTGHYDMELQRKESKEFLSDLTTRDQRMMQAVLTLVITADSKQQLDSDTEKIRSLSGRHPEVAVWPAICTTYAGAGGLGLKEADEYDLGIIREAGDRFLDLPEVKWSGCTRELKIPAEPAMGMRFC